MIELEPYKQTLTRVSASVKESVWVPHDWLLNAWWRNMTSFQGSNLTMTWQRKHFNSLKDSFYRHLSCTPSKVLRDVLFMKSLRLKKKTWLKLQLQYLAERTWCPYMDADALCLMEGLNNWIYEEWIRVWSSDEFPDDSRVWRRSDASVLSDCEQSRIWMFFRTMAQWNNGEHAGWQHSGCWLVLLFIPL